MSADADAMARPCEPWKFLASSAWTATAIAAWLAVQFLVFIGLLVYMGVGDDATAHEIDTLSSHAVVISLVAIVAAPAEIGIIALAIRFARCRFSDYVALVWPRRRELLIGIGLLVLMLPLADLSAYLSGRAIVPPFVVEAYRSARDSGTLPLLFLALAVAAPVTEEIVFRGFLYRGYAASRVGPAGAILIPAALWSVMHLQYEAFFIFQIFLLGVVLGWLRWRTGSLWLTIILHAIINAASLLQTAFIVEYLS